MISELTRARMSASARKRLKRDPDSAALARNIFTQVMLNGKELRHCTFAEVSTFGQRYAKLAVKGDPAQVVGQLLSEKQVRDSAIRVGGAGVKPGTIKPSVSENDFIKVRSLNPMGEPLIEACPTRGSGGQPAMHPTGR